MAKSEHRRPPKPVIAIVVLAVLGGIGYWWWTTQQTATAESTLLSGTIESGEYQVASAIAGRIIEVPVAEGDLVEEGDIIAKLDDAALKLQLDQANSGVKAAKAQVTQAKDDGTKAEVTAAKARLEQARAAVKLAKVQLGYAEVRAPNAGVVVALAANAGQNAGPGKTIATLSDPTDLFVRAYVPEPQVADAVVGASATVKSNGADYPGTISFVAANAEFTPNTVETREQRGNLVYEIRVRVTDPTGALKAGLPVDVEL